MYIVLYRGCVGLMLPVLQYFLTPVLLSTSAHVFGMDMAVLFSYCASLEKLIMLVR